MSLLESLLCLCVSAVSDADLVVGFKVQAWLSLVLLAARLPARSFGVSSGALVALWDAAGAWVAACLCAVCMGFTGGCACFCRRLRERWPPDSSGPFSASRPRQAHCFSISRMPSSSVPSVSCRKFWCFRCMPPFIT